MKHYVKGLCLAILVTAAFAVPALALGVNPHHRGAPGPLLGAGLPLLLLLGGGYFVARRLRRERD
jgi:hypothetical protein